MHVLTPDAYGWELTTADGITLDHDQFNRNPDTDDQLAQEWADRILDSPQDWQRVLDEANWYRYEADGGSPQRAARPTC